MSARPSARAFLADSDPNERARMPGSLARRYGPCRFDVLERDFGRAEQVRIDGVEIVVVSGEDRRERLAVVP